MMRPFFLSRTFLVLLTPIAFVQAYPQFSHNPSFGLLKKETVTLKGRLPPIYNARGKTIAIGLENPKGDLPTEVQIALEKQLTQNDSSIRVGGNRPDLVIDCNITRYSAPKEQSSTQNGQTTVTLLGTLSVAFRIFEPANSHVVKSDIATSEYVGDVSHTSAATGASKVFGLKLGPSGPVTTQARTEFKTTDELQRYMVSDVATKIASYVVNTEQPVPVLLAVGGGLDEPDKLALSGLWPRYLETLETLRPFPELKYDAYRTYNIGVANEALAYVAQDSRSALKYLQQASIDYGKALEQKPDEKYFLPAQNRIKLALSHYTELQNSASATVSATTLAKAEANGADHPLDNEDIIDMVRNHMDEANVLDTIQTATSYKFDISPKGQIELVRGGVNGKILMAMKQKARTATAAAK